MFLKSAHVTNFKSIEDCDEVAIDPDVTVLVGQNESGKTAFLQALNKAASVDKDASFDIYQDYPRRLLNQYERRHKSDPDEVVVLTYRAEQRELDRINAWAGFELTDDVEFSHNHYYDNVRKITFSTPEQS